MPHALEGVSVIDLTHHIAGPYCTKLLADYGAEVIKVERPDGGDPARRMGPFFHNDPHPEKSGLFLHLNTNKRSITLNLKTALGKGILKDLAREADILVENFHPRVMPRLGLDYPALEQINPRLVMTSISNFGHTGPYRDYKMSEITAYAMGGVMHGTGMPDKEPIKLALTVEQFYSGNVAASATLGAFIGAQVHGIGQQLDLAIMEMQTGNQDRGIASLMTYQYSGEPSHQRRREFSRSILPTGVYPCADGYVQFAGGPLSRWGRFCHMIDRPDLANDAHFTTPENFFASPEVKQEVETMLYAWLFQHTKQEVMEKGQEYGYLTGAINTMEDVFNDSHLAAREFFVEIDHPFTGPLQYPGANFKMSETPWRAGRAPLLGEHNREVYCDRLGFSPEDLVRMREQGVI
ncbi:MAG: CoA transferase [Chloroflexi bacterium]|nr:CoA transferase [Chloroflexota bacterium]